MAPKRKKLLNILCFIAFCAVVGVNSQLEDDLKTAVDYGRVKIHNIEKARGEPVMQKKEESLELHIYCKYNVDPRTFTRVFSSANVYLNIGDQYAIYKGDNESHVFQQHTQASRSWFQLMPWKADSVSLNPFNKTCIGVSSEKDYTVKYTVKLLDPWMIGFFFAGLVLFLSANRLSRNVMLYYGTGVSLGTIASILILLYIFSKYIPKKITALLLYGASSISIVGYLCQHVWLNLQTITQEYFVYVVGYFALSMAISFCICYYKGPPTSPRALDLIKWFLQLVALVLMFCGMQIPQIALLAIGLVIFWHNFPRSIWRRFVRYWRVKFPRPRKLLSEEEYRREGAEETRKALEELREFCRSPDCDPWKTISRLGSPTRFASFVEGDSHVTDDELMHYDSDHQTTLPRYDTDEESEISFSLNSQ